MTSTDAKIRARCAALCALLCAGTLHAEGTFFKNRRTAGASPPASAESAPPVRVPATPPDAPAPTSGGVVAASGSGKPPLTSGPIVPPPQPDPPPPPAPPPGPPAAAAAPGAASHSGAVDRVVTTDTLSVAGQTVQLAGVVGSGGASTAGLQHYLQAQGNHLSCQAVGARYRCLTDAGKDLGLLVLMNGAGRASSDAPAAYQEAEAQARAAGKGLWRR